MNRRSFLSTLGLGALSLPALAKVLAEPVPTPYRVARFVMMPTIEVDENGCRIGRRTLGPEQIETFVDVKVTLLGADQRGETHLFTLTREDGTSEEFQIEMTEGGLRGAHRIVGYRGIEVDHLSLSLSIPRQDYHDGGTLGRIDDVLLDPPMVEASWQEVRYV